MEMVTITIKLNKDNNDFLKEYRDHLNEKDLRAVQYGRCTKEGVLNSILNDARVKFEKQQKREGVND